MLFREAPAFGVMPKFVNTFGAGWVADRPTAVSRRRGGPRDASGRAIGDSPNRSGSSERHA